MSVRPSRHLETVPPGNRNHNYLNKKHQLLQTMHDLEISSKTQQAIQQKTTVVTPMKIIYFHLNSMKKETMSITKWLNSRLWVKTGQFPDALLKVLNDTVYIEIQFSACNALLPQK